MKYNIFSAICLALYIILFSLIFSHISFGSFGRVIIISMLLFPLLGTIFAFKGKKGGSKWLLLLLNSIAFLALAYVLLLSNMGED